MAEIVPVILSGGAGTRLWPMSRELHPKQFHRIFSDTTLFQDAVRRQPSAAPIVVCSNVHKQIVLDQLREIDVSPRQLIMEPCGRNTAPAIAAAALYMENSNPDAVLLVMPSDQRIEQIGAFRVAVQQAAVLAAQGHVVLFGVRPDRAHTGYGYIEMGEALGEGYRVAKFVEKPDAETAGHYVASGRFVWNSGIFMFSVKAILAELTKHCPDVLASCRDALAAAKTDDGTTLLNEAVFSTTRNISIDFAVMEHTDHAALIPVELGWSDLGSWSSLKDASPNDTVGNALIGDVVAVNTQNSYVRSERQLVATLGVKDLVVVATDDVVLVANRDSDQQLKELVAELKRNNRQEALQANEVHRPWGSYKTIEEGDRFRVKQIVVQPGQKLSLQKHWHRSEHWIVVRGTGLVTAGDKTFVLRENESTFIPAATVHRLENPGKVPLHMIEVQSGTYVGEDDIVRFDDVYGRN